MTNFLNKLLQKKIWFFVPGAILAALVFFVVPKQSQAATFSVSPSLGVNTVGSTFDVSILVDTKGQEINAVDVQLSFPPDKLQLVSPSTGNSIISIYTTPPKYDNATGQVQIIGGIPNGINVSAGLITKLTFRVKGVGTATLRFSGNSQVLLNDGRGTNVLDNTTGASFKLELPPQQGPIVISDTHPDQEIWYKNASVALQWDIGLPPAENYSYTISDNPTDVPDDTPEGNSTSVDYKRAPDGINYFHIKAFRDGRWGGVSRYSLRIDTQAPAEFPVEVSPHSRTFITKPFFQFSTTDTLSGLERYELKILPLKVDGRPKAVADDQLYVEAQSPYASPELLHGSYDVIVRAYDRAGNVREVAQKLVVTDSWFWFVGESGIELPFGKHASWRVIVLFALFLLGALLIVAYIVRKWYHLTHHKVASNHLPATLRSQLDELQKYRSKYGNLTSILLVAVTLGMLWFAPVQAADLTPPVTDSYSSNIKDDELFYISGRTQEPNSEVVVHLQSMVDGSTFDFTITSDKRGDWTYRHNSFLAGGKYILWTHTKIGEQLSVPSPQVSMDVKPVAINWGGSRITYQSIYIGVISGLILVIVGLIVYIILHAVLVRRRRKQFGSHLRQAEDSIKRGFMILHRDIEAELNLVKQANLSGDLAGEQKVRAEQLEIDLKAIEDLVGKEFWQVQSLGKLLN